MQNGIRCNQRQAFARAKQKGLVRVPYSGEWHAVLSKVAAAHPLFDIECCLNPKQAKGEPQFLLWVSVLAVRSIKELRPVTETGKVNMRAVYSILEALGGDDADVAMVLHMFSEND